jgi:CBS domain-containing protein
VKCPACGHDNLPGVDLCARCLESLMQEDVPQPETPVERSIMIEPIASLRSPAPATVRQEAPVADAVRQMRETNVGYVLVLDGDDKLAGILTERDLLCKVAGQINDLDSLPISKLMTPNPTSLRPSEPIKHALFVMAHNGYRHVPLVDEEGRPAALATVRHVIEYIEGITNEES